MLRKHRLAHLFQCWRLLWDVRQGHWKNRKRKTIFTGIQLKVDRTIDRGKDTLHEADICLLQCLISTKVIPGGMKASESEQKEYHSRTRATNLSVHKPKGFESSLN